MYLTISKRLHHILYVFNYLKASTSYPTCIQLSQSVYIISYMYLTISKRLHNILYVFNYLKRLYHILYVFNYLKAST